MTISRRDFLKTAGALSGALILVNTTVFGTGCAGSMAVEAGGRTLLETLRSVGFRPVRFEGRNTSGTIIAMDGEDARSMRPHDGSFWIVRDSRGNVIENPDVWNTAPQGFVSVNREPYRPTENPHHAEWLRART